MSIVLTDFARARLFPADGRRTAIQGCTAAEFEARFGIPLTRVGTVLEGAPGIVADGLARVANAPGHSHFSG